MDKRQIERRRVENMSKTIPISDLPEGLKMCAEKSESFFKAAKELVTKNMIGEGYILTVYGLEEVGRAVLFDKSMNDAITSNNDFIRVGKELINHKDKQQLAMSILPNNLVNLAMGTFNPQYYNLITNTGGKLDVLQDLRERAQFVDYNQNKWQTQASMDPKGLTMFISGVEEESTKFINNTIKKAEENRQGKT